VPRASPRRRRHAIRGRDPAIRRTPRRAGGRRARLARIQALVSFIMRIPSRFVAALAVALAAGSSMVRADDCAYGPYRGPQGEVVALSRPAPGAGPGARYTFLDGRRGFLSDAGAPIACEAGALHARGATGAASWTPVPMRATPTRFRSGDAMLNGLLLEPAGVERPPLVVSVHGSEKTSPIGLATQYLFVAEGVALFAYDKRGTAGSEGVYTQDFILLAQDAAHAAREARRLAGARMGRLGFLGGSQGGWVAPLAALQAGADFLEVGFPVLGTAVEQDQWQVDYQLLHEHGFDPAILPKVHSLTDATGAVARSDFRAGMDRVRALKAAFAQEPWLKDVDGQYSGGLVNGEVARMRDESPQVTWEYAGLDTVRALRVPQLWVFAEDDDVAPSAPSIARLQAIRGEGTPIRAIVFPHATHGILRIAIDPATGRRQDLGVYAPGYFRVLTDFAKGATPGPYGDGRWLD
jgi:dienelactone hydrolase